MIDAFYQKQIDSLHLQTRFNDCIDVSKHTAEQFTNALVTRCLMPWDGLTQQYDNFHCVGKLSAGEVATLALYTLDYTYWFFISEDAQTADQAPSYSGSQYTDAQQLLIDWWDAENAAFKQSSANHAA